MDAGGNRYSGIDSVGALHIHLDLIELSSGNAQGGIALSGGFKFSHEVPWTDAMFNINSNVISFVGSRKLREVDSVKRFGDRYIAFYGHIIY